MAKRKSINGKLPRHENPIPNASRIGNIIMSSVIGGTNPGTRDLPESLEQQVANVFTHIRHDVEAAGASVDDIIKITFWVKNPAAQRAALNGEWVKMFPDPEARPARHTLWEYVFFVDIEGHRAEPAVQAALDELGRRAAYLKVLGSDPLAVY